MTCTIVSSLCSVGFFARIQSILTVAEVILVPPCYERNARFRARRYSHLFVATNMALLIGFGNHSRAWAVRAASVFVAIGSPGREVLQNRGRHGSARPMMSVCHS